MSDTLLAAYKWVKDNLELSSALAGGVVSLVTWLVPGLRQWLLRLVHRTFSMPFRPADKLAATARLAWTGAAIETAARAGATLREYGTPAEQQQIGIIDQQLKDLHRRASKHTQGASWTVLDGVQSRLMEMEPNYHRQPEAQHWPADPLSAGFVNALATLSGLRTHDIPAEYGAAATHSQHPFGRDVVKRFSERVRDAVGNREVHEFYLAELERQKGLPAEPAATAPTNDVKPFDWSTGKFDFDQYHDDKLQGFTGRGWLLERIKTWASDPQARAAMLITAGFGVGKTATMSALYRQWRDERGTRYGAWHFCRYDHDRTLIPGLIVRSIASQLGTQIEAYRRRIDNDPTLQEYLKDAQRDPRTALVEAVYKPLGELGLDRNVFICIDALDESNDLVHAPGWKGSTLSVLLRDTRPDAPARVRLLATSRSVDGTRRDSLQEIFDVVDLDREYIVQQRADMEEYVRGQAATRPTVHDFLNRTRKSASDLVEHVHPRGAPDDAGGFLLLHSVVDEIAKDTAQALRFEDLPRRMDVFYERTFDIRLERLQLDKDQVRSVLHLIAVARQPLPESVLGAVLAPDCPVKAVQKIHSAFAGLLVRNLYGGITFAHFSLENWLRGTITDSPAPAGDFAITTQAAEQAEIRLADYCQREEHLPLQPTSPFIRYLWQGAIPLLAKHGRFSAALRLLTALRNFVASGRHPREPFEDPSQVEHHADVVVAELQKRWDAIDEVAGSARPVLGRADAGDLLQLLQHKRYATGMYVPVLRTLIECCPDEWPGIRDAMLQNKAENDIVFRHDTGVAYARAWRLAPAGQQGRHLQAIETMARDTTSAHQEDLREIAGYALKYVCQQTDRAIWWGDLIDPHKGGVLHQLGALFAASDSATDRMVAGEMLLALALQQVRVTAWWQEPAYARFWNPYWHNLGADIDAIQVALRPDAGATSSRFLPVASLEDARRQQAMAMAWMARLDTCNYRHRCGLPTHWDGVLTSQMHQQNDVTIDDDHSVRAFVTALQPKSRVRRGALRLIKLVMLHPQWNVTERAAALLAEIVAHDDRLEPLFHQLAGGPHTPPRIRYGAIDAAFAYGDGRSKPDSFRIFFELLLQHGRDGDCRVRGICSDDLDGWLRQAPSREVRQRLNDVATVNLFASWLTQADDIWLIEYLHNILHYLKHPDLLSGSALGKRLAGLRNQLSEHLALPAGAEEFEQQEAGAFLTRVEDRRHAAWRAHVGQA